MHCRQLLSGLDGRIGFTFGREGGGNQERQVVEATLACCGNCLWNSLQCRNNSALQCSSNKPKSDLTISYHVTFIFSVEYMLPVILHFAKQDFEIWKIPMDKI